MKSTSMIREFVVILLSTLFLSVNTATILHAQSLDLTVKGYGLSFGNSRRLNGVRFNLRDNQVEVVNGIKGKQTGVSLGIVNYAYELKGIQIGLINYVRENPKYLKVLPLINARF